MGQSADRSSQLVVASLAIDLLVGLRADFPSARAAEGVIGAPAGQKVPADGITGLEAQFIFVFGVHTTLNDRTRPLDGSVTRVARFLGLLRLDGGSDVLLLFGWRQLGR